MMTATPASSHAEMNLAELVRESLAALVPVTIGVVWLWAVYSVLFLPRYTAQTYLVLIVVTATALTGALWPGLRLRSAIWLYLGGLSFAAGVLTLTFPGPATFALFAPLVLIVAILTNSWVTWLIAVASSLFVGYIGLSVAGFDTTTVALSVSVILVTGLVGWLSGRRLFTALSWALHMTEVSLQNAELARNHRAELQRVLKTLEIAHERLERANRTLIFAQETAQQAYRFKAEFVANVSHELRTPLNLIIGFSEMMATAPESYGGVPLPKEYRGDVMATYRSARHLLELVNDVLDLSQIEAGRMAITKERIDLLDVVRETAAIVSGLADARGLRLELVLPAEPVYLELDRTRIRQVLLNLLTNSMRYTKKGWVRVEVSSAADEMQVVVADSGPGIAPEKLTHAFEAFSRLNEEQIRDGSGLGLAVSKQFVELHEGTMEIKSEVGMGTSVSFTLPLPAQTGMLPLARIHRSRQLTRGAHAHAAFVLHNDPHTVELLRRYIDHLEFVLVHSEEMLAQLLETTLPEMVIADDAVVGWWRSAAASRPEAKAIPLISCRLPGVRHLGPLLGATDFLPKPITRDDVTTALGRLPVAPKTALVIDDNPHIVRLIGRMLKAIDPEMRVYEAFGGAEGLQIARDQRPDVIFLDLVMPDISGFGVIAEIGREPALAGVNLIIVSVRSIEEESTPIPGDLRVERLQGITLSELLQLIQAIVDTLMRPDAVSPASVGAVRPDRPG